MSPRTCKRLCKRIQRVTFNNVGSYWPTILRPFMVKGKRGVLWEISGPEDGQMVNIMRSNYQNQSHLAPRLRGLKQKK